MQKITPFLWFDNNAEEAVAFYTSIFEQSEGSSELINQGSGTGKKGSVIAKNFTLNGQEFIALNGGPHVKFNEAVSLFIRCKDQQEVDYFWEKLLEGGTPSQCGWLKDKFGLSWQVVPEGMMELVGDKDPERANRAMKAMMQMVKLDINKVRDAADGK